jgi:hypothetical protein
MDQTTAALVDELEANRSMFEALVRACRPSALEREAQASGWAVGEIVAHVAASDLLTIRQLTTLLEVQSETARLQPPVEPGLNLDDWNLEQVRTRAGQTLEALLAEMEAHRIEALDLLRLLPEGAGAHEVPYPADRSRAGGRVPLRLWLKAWSKHDMVHGRDIMRALPELGRSLDFQSWLAGEPLLEGTGGPGA